MPAALATLGGGHGSSPRPTSLRRNRAAGAASPCISLTLPPRPPSGTITLTDSGELHSSG